MALELSNRSWRLGFSNGAKIRQKTVEARALERVLAEIELAKQKLGVEPGARVVACYEAGRDGHWIYRWLRSVGVEVLVIDSSSIERAQGRKHVKTDGVDVERLLDLLIRYCMGLRRGMRVVRVPDEAAEAALRLHREDERLVKERGRVANRMRSILATQGLVDVRLGLGFETWLERVRLWNGNGLAAELKAELRRLYEHYRLLGRQLAEVARAYRAELESDSAVGNQRARLEVYKGIGPKLSRVMSAEAFAWRKFRNNKQVGSMAGLTPTPNQSGDLSREQGIGKHGNRRVRHMAIELAWLWLRWQPQSALSKWFRERFGGGSKRMRRVGIVALARKLLVALWRYLEQGVVLEGAIMKTA
jgi:transposase